MAEWWSYRPEDFLLFSPRVYWRLFELHNAAWWPGQTVALAVLAGLIWLAATRAQGHGRWIAAGLALAWGFSGWAYVLERYATINWAAAHLAPLFAIEAVLLAAAAAAGSLVVARRGASLVAGWALVAAALLYPLQAPLAGRPLAAAEVFALAPDPTAIATLGLLLMMRGGLRWALLPVPLAWCAVSALTLWTMDEAVALLPAAAVAMTILCLAGEAVPRLRSGGASAHRRPG